MGRGGGERAGGTPQSCVTGGTLIKRQFSNMQTKLKLSQTLASAVWLLGIFPAAVIPNPILADHVLFRGSGAPPKDAAATLGLCFGNRKKPGGIGGVQAGARGSRVGLGARTPPPTSPLLSEVSLLPAAPQSSHREAGTGGSACSTEVTRCGVWLGACHTVSPFKGTTGPY